MTQTDKRPLLLQCLRRFDDTVWLYAAFNVLKDGLEAIGIDGSNPALSMSIGTNKELNVNIGQRWVWKANEDGTLSFILPMSADPEALGADSIMNPYTRNGIPDAQWCSFPFKKGMLSRAVRNEWITAMKTEMSRTTKSGFRKFHSPLFWDMIMLEDLRADLFTDAFSK